MLHLPRRQFLQQSATTIGSFSVVATFGNFLLGDVVRRPTQLRAAVDQSTGLPLLELPEGFEYRTFGWTGDKLPDGTPTPGDHDGMAVIRTDDSGLLTLCRNHEASGNGRAFGSASHSYDRRAAGGLLKSHIRSSNRRMARRLDQSLRER